MVQLPDNLVFEGGGVLGIAYLGALHYFYQEGLLQNLKRTAGTSAGAITACITSFNLPFEELKKIVDSLEYKKIPQSKVLPDLKKITEPMQIEFESMFGDISCIYRLITKYGWYSTDYFYQWMQAQITAQFDQSKKAPPYTFADFKNPFIHKGQRHFHDLYIIGTDLSYHISRIFSYETTPDMEVALAVKISMSIPLFFEAVELDLMGQNDSKNLFCDGGVMWNYPINIFDSAPFNGKGIPDVNWHTLGLRFLNREQYHPIRNFIDYIYHLYRSLLCIQQNMFDNSPTNKARSIQIDTENVSYVDFDIITADNTYRFLYNQGYQAASDYFINHLS